MDENFVSGRAKKAQSFLLRKYSADYRVWSRKRPQKKHQLYADAIFSHFTSKLQSFLQNNAL